MDPANVTYSKLQLFSILIFSYIGATITQVTRSYPNGFYLDFIEKEGLDSTLWNIAVSTMLLTSSAAPFAIRYIPRFMSLPLHVRVVFLLLLNAVFTAMTAAVDATLNWNESGWVAFTIIFISRSLQGFTASFLFIIVQGELVDLYLKQYKILIVIVSTSLHIGFYLGSTVGAKFYIAGGWLTTGLGIASLNFVLLLALPLLVTVQKSDNMDSELVTFAKDKSDPLFNEDTTSGKPPCFAMNWAQTFAFYTPDFLVFYLNVIYNLLCFAIPARMVKYNERSLEDAVAITNLMSVFGVIAGVIFGVISLKMNVLVVISMGNIMFPVGTFLMFGATTDYFNFFHFQYQVGALLLGFGDAACVNQVVMSKFIMLEKMGLPIPRNLGEYSSAVFNVAFGISAALGIAVSGLTLGRHGEIGVFIGTGAMWLIASCALIFASIVIYKKTET